MLIVSFALYPQLKSSEGIVNDNWITILNKNIKCYVLSAWTTLKFSENKIKNKNNFLLEKLYNISTSKSKSILVFTYKSINKIVFKITGKSLFQFFWIIFQTKKMLEFNRLGLKCVVWLRILPAWPIKIIIKSYKKEPFPLIINCNDPFSSIYEENDFKKSAKIAQCWTFPSNKLANFFSKKYDLDRDRCFVIPHAMQNQEIIYNQNFNIHKKIRFLYTGTFYKSAFTESFKKQISDFAKSNIGQNLEFIFILSQYDEESILWLKNAIPNSILKFQLEREEVLTYTKSADCILVIDSESHRDLLKGKLIEAFSFGIPVFAITYDNSVMDILVKRYGCISGYQNIENNILNSFFQITENLKNEKWREKFSYERTKILDLISEEKIFELTNSINEFAYDRFLWQQKKISTYPKEPKTIDWI